MALIIIIIQDSCQFGWLCSRFSILYFKIITLSIPCDGCRYLPLYLILYEYKNSYSSTFDNGRIPLFLHFYA